MIIIVIVQTLQPQTINLHSAAAPILNRQWYMVVTITSDRVPVKVVAHTSTYVRIQELFPNRAQQAILLTVFANWPVRLYVAVLAMASVKQQHYRRLMKEQKTKSTTKSQQRIDHPLAKWVRSSIKQSGCSGSSSLISLTADCTNTVNLYYQQC